jgi:hypothetical protein
MSLGLELPLRTFVQLLQGVSRKLYDPVAGAGVTLEGLRGTHLADVDEGAATTYVNALEEVRGSTPLDKGYRKEKCIPSRGRRYDLRLANPSTDKCVLVPRQLLTRAGAEDWELAVLDQKLAEMGMGGDNKEAFGNYWRLERTKVWNMAIVWGAGKPMENETQCLPCVTTRETVSIDRGRWDPLPFEV